MKSTPRSGGRASAGRCTSPRSVRPRCYPRTRRTAPPPPVYVSLFERNGFGGASLALDALLLHDMSREQRLGYLAHELHHAFRSRVERLHLDRNDPDCLLVAAISSLAEEGIASLLAKRHCLEPGYPESPEEPWRGIVTTFVEAYGRSAQILADVDRHLRRIAGGEASPSEVGPQIKSGLPWGGHPTGMYMALAIEEELGPDVIPELAPHPLDFILEYREAAERNAALYRFTDQAIALVRELRRRHTS